MARPMDGAKIIKDNSVLDLKKTSINLVPLKVLKSSSKKLLVELIFQLGWQLQTNCTGGATKSTVEILEEKKETQMNLRKWTSSMVRKLLI